MTRRDKDDDKTTGFSLHPDDQVEGGGDMLQSGEVEITEAKWVDRFKYPGSSGALGTVLLLDLRDDEDNSHNTFYSIGAPQNWKVSKDGSKLIPTGGQSGLSQSSNAGLFFASLKDAGFDDWDGLADDISVLEGLRIEVIRKPQPVREGLTKRTDGRTPTFLLVAELVEEKKGKKGKAKAKRSRDDEPDDDEPKTRRSKREEPEDDDDDEDVTDAIEAVKAVLEAKDGEVTRKRLGLLVLGLPDLKKHERKQEIAQLACDPDFLEEHFDYDSDEETITAKKKKRSRR